MEPVSTILQDADARTEILSRGAAPTGETGLSLVGRAEQIFRYGRAAEDAAPLPETPAYPDGYMRRSPPQPYRVPEGYYRRLIVKAALCVAAVVLLALLLVTLVQRRLLRF